MTTSPSDTLTLLDLAGHGDPGGTERLLELVYSELRALAAASMTRERSDHTLQPTALVHEVYLRLLGQRDVKWEGKSHFLAIAATMMRRVLVDHARAHAAAKRRGGGEGGAARGAGTLNDAELLGSHDASLLDSIAGVDIEALDQALFELARLNARHARVVELRFFGGLDVAVTAEVLGVCERTVKEDWRIARAWLRARLGPPKGG